MSRIEYTSNLTESNREEEPGAASGFQIDRSSYTHKAFYRYPKHNSVANACIHAKFVAHERGGRGGNAVHINRGTIYQK